MFPSLSNKMCVIFKKQLYSNLVAWTTLYLLIVQQSAIGVTDYTSIIISTTECIGTCLVFIPNLNAYLCLKKHCSLLWSTNANLNGPIKTENRKKNFLPLIIARQYKRKILASSEVSSSPIWETVFHYLCDNQAHSWSCEHQWARRLQSLVI